LPKSPRQQPTQRNRDRNRRPAAKDAGQREPYASRNPDKSP
jgi:hypothetical protein